MYNISSISNNDVIRTVNGNYFIDPFMFFKSKILEFTSLPNDWDGYGAVPLLKEIGVTATTFVTMLSSSYIDYISDIFPNPNGTLTIDWENQHGEKLSLEIGLKNYSFFVKYLNKQPNFVNGEDIIMDRESVTEALSELFSENIFTGFF